MKRLLLFLFFPIMTLSQSTTVSTTGVVDTDGFAWSNGTYSITFVPSPSWPNIGTYVWTGGNLLPFNPTNGTLNGSGVFSVSLPSNTAITPSGSQWKFTICPNASAGCFSVNTAVTGSTQDITATLNAAAKGPRFAANPFAFGYGAIEVNPIPQPGAFFYNTSSNTCTQWNGTAYQSCATGGSGITQLTGPVQAGPGTGSQPAQITSTGVVPGFYTNLNATVNAAGQILSAANGTATGGLPVNNPTFIGTMTGGVYGQNFLNPPYLAAPQSQWSAADWMIGTWNGPGEVNGGQYPGQTTMLRRVSYSEAGHTLGQPPVGPQGWTLNFPYSTIMVNRSQAQFHTDFPYHWQYGVGDWTGDNGYAENFDWNGVPAPGDEGGEIGGSTNGGEDSSACTTTIKTAGGGAGATTLVTYAARDCISFQTDQLAAIGDGHFALDITDPIASGAVVHYVSGSGEVPEIYTMSVTGGSVTPSTAQGVLNGDCTPTNNLNGSQTQTVTCAITSTSSVTSITNSGGSGMTAGTYPLVFGSGTAAGTITVTSSSVTGYTITNPGFYTYGVAPTVTAATGGTPPTLTAIVNSGIFVANGLVSFAGQFHEQARITSVSGTVPNQSITLPIRHGHESTSWIMQGGTQGFVVFTANIGDGLKYPITVLGATSSTNVIVRPFAYAQTTANGASSYSGPLEFGGSQAYTIYPGAEVLDVQDVANNYAIDGTVTVEPNNGIWPNGGTWEEEHSADAHHAMVVYHEHIHGAAQAGQQQGWTGIAMSIDGAAAVSPNVWTGYDNYSGNEGAVLDFANQETPTNYSCPTCKVAWGGIMPAPGFIRNFGPWMSLAEMQFAPTGGVLLEGCPMNGSGGSNCPDPTFTNDLWFLEGNAGQNITQWVPFTDTLNFQGIDNFTNPLDTYQGTANFSSFNGGVISSGLYSNYVPMSIASSVNSLTASSSGAVLTVTAVAPGSGLGVGQYINGSGITANTYQIVSFGSGTGQTGTYNLNLSLSVSSEAMTSTNWASVGSNAYASVTYNTTDYKDPYGGNAATKLVPSGTVGVTGNFFLNSQFPTPLPANTAITLCMWTFSPNSVAVYFAAGGPDVIATSTTGWTYSCALGTTGTTGLNAGVISSYTAGAFYVYGVNVSLAATPSAGFDTTGYQADVTPHLGANVPFLAGAPVPTHCANFLSATTIQDAGAACFLQLTGTTGTITGTALTATCDSGTATVTGAVVGHTVGVSTTDGTDVGGAFYLRASVTATNTVTVYVCGTGTPPSKAYNVTTY